MPSPTGEGTLLVESRDVCRQRRRGRNASATCARGSYFGRWVELNEPLYALSLTLSTGRGDSVGGGSRRLQTTTPRQECLGYVCRGRTLDAASYLDGLFYALSLTLSHGARGLRWWSLALFADIDAEAGMPRLRWLVATA